MPIKTIKDRPCHCAIGKREIAKNVYLVCGLTYSLIPFFDHMLVHIMQMSKGSITKTNHVFVPKVVVRREMDHGLRRFCSGSFLSFVFVQFVVYRFDGNTQDLSGLWLVPSGFTQNQG